MADPRYDKLGAVVVPPTTVSTDGQSLVATCDPALVNLLAAFKAILNTKLDATWAKAAKGIASHVVVGTYEYEPTQPVQTLTWLWPALFMWRVRERYFKRTEYWRDAEVTGKLVYILPPLPMDVFVKLQPIRVAVRTTLHMLIEKNGDPSYSAGADIIAASNLESFAFTESTFGSLQAAGELELYHPVLDMTWVMRERQLDVTTGLLTLSSISSGVYLVGDDETETLIVEDYFDATTE